MKRLGRRTNKEIYKWYSLWRKWYVILPVYTGDVNGCRS